MYICAMRGRGRTGSGRSHEAFQEVEDPSLIKEPLRNIKAICFACDPVTLSEFLWRLAVKACLIT